MASQIVRSIRNVSDVEQLAEHVTTINDIVSETDGTVYVKTVNGFVAITGGASESDITSLKSENTKLKNRVTDLETRIEALENADTTT